jgi:hypothetical protein
VLFTPEASASAVLLATTDDKGGIRLPGSTADRMLTMALPGLDMKPEEIGRATASSGPVVLMPYSKDIQPKRSVFMNHWLVVPAGSLRATPAAGPSVR